MTIVVTGAGGMLGQAVVAAAKAAGHVCAPYTRRQLDITDAGHMDTALAFVPPPFTIINCAAIILGRQARWTKGANSVNAMAPHSLAMRCARLVQVSTDCVFDGASPIPYSENDMPNATGWYGGMKIAGEVQAGPHVTVRGSFIGFQHGLLAWLLAQPKDATVQGYVDHKWTGTYVADFADALVEIAARPRSIAGGVVHLVGTETTKHQLLTQLAALLRPDVEVAYGRGPDGPRYMNLASTKPGVPALPHWRFSIQRLVRDYNARASVTP